MKKKASIPPARADLEFAKSKEAEENSKLIEDIQLISGSNYNNEIEAMLRATGKKRKLTIGPNAFHEFREEDEDPQPKITKLTKKQANGKADKYILKSIHDKFTKNSRVTTTKADTIYHIMHDSLYAIVNAPNANDVSVLLQRGIPFTLSSIDVTQLLMAAYHRLLELKQEEKLDPGQHLIHQRSIHAAVDSILQHIKGDTGLQHIYLKTRDLLNVNAGRQSIQSGVREADYENMDASLKKIADNVKGTQLEGIIILLHKLPNLQINKVGAAQHRRKLKSRKAGWKSGKEVKFLPRHREYGVSDKYRWAPVEKEVVKDAGIPKLSPYESSSSTDTDRSTSPSSVESDSTKRKHKKPKLSAEADDEKASLALAQKLSREDYMGDRAPRIRKPPERFKMNMGKATDAYGFEPVTLPQNKGHRSRSAGAPHDEPADSSRGKKKKPRGS